MDEAVNELINTCALGYLNIVLYVHFAQLWPTVYRAGNIAGRKLAYAFVWETAKLTLQDREDN